MNLEHNKNKMFMIGAGISFMDIFKNIFWHNLIVGVEKFEHGCLPLKTPKKCQIVELHCSWIENYNSRYHI